MQVIQSHPQSGTGPIRVESADLPVCITVDPDAERRQVHVLADRGLGAYVGPGGPRGREMRICVARPGLISSLFGLRRGTSSVGGGSVISGGKGSIVSGGDIRFAATGNGSRVVIDGQPVQPKGPGVHLTVPPGCTFDIRQHGGITVHYNASEMTIETAAEIGILQRA